MSKISKKAYEMAEDNKLRRDEVVTNFMGGDSYVLDPLTTLKMVSASSIFGEPAYYRKGMDGRYSHDRYVTDSIIPDAISGKNTSDVMTMCIDNALSYDFEGTLQWAVECRNEMYMRLNPQIIMVHAAIHPDREKWTADHPGKFAEYNKKVMFRADDALSQMSYYLYQNKGKKNNIPTIIKKSWANKLSNLTKYQVAKYKNAEIGMINGVRLCHANSEVLDELMRTGSVQVDEDEKTWENLRSAGKDWKTIFHTVKMGHMALLRNLRGVFSEVDDLEFCKEYLAALKDGVLSGKQFPFRYYSAIKAVEDAAASVHHAPVIIDALEECLDISVDNMPHIKGKTMALSDNSGSAWGCFNSEYGTVTVAEIDNLSAVIAAACSDEGYVGKFGNKLIVYPISKRQGILAQARKISHGRADDVGGATEGGIWEFFNGAISKKEHWDNILIFSDQQAGTGRLYGTDSQAKVYGRTYGIGFGWSTYINVYKLILDYRKSVFKKVNVLSVQTAGYTNSVVPQSGYRTDLTAGWTGKEIQYLVKKSELWDSFESGCNSKQ